MKVFLSHSGENKDLVREVYTLLSEKDAWLDEVDIKIGELIPEKISKGIEQSSHFVLFWSDAAARSKWVNLELNAAFVAYCSEKCNILVFPLDDVELPLILKPFRYNKVDATNIKDAASAIYRDIISVTTKASAQNSFVNRTREIGEIEDAKNCGKRLIVISGLSGIGKLSLALRAVDWLYSDRRPIIVDLNLTKGIPEFCLKLATQFELEIPDDLSSDNLQNECIEMLLEAASFRKVILIFRNAKSWLNDNGTPNKALSRIIHPILETRLFSEAPVFITSTRFINLPISLNTTTYSHCVRLGALNEKHISAILHNNLPKSFIEEGYDEIKNTVFARQLFGYPLAARISANLITIHGYDYFISQPLYIKNLTTGLARELISYNKLSDACDIYLKLIALTNCSLRNDEINEAFPKMSLKNISMISEEAYHAGIVFFEDGRYIIEDIVQGVYFDAAFEDPARKEIVHHVANYVMSKLSEKTVENSAKHARLLPCAIFLLALDGQYKRASLLRRDMLATMLSSAWAQYNHRAYDEVKSIVKVILDQCDNDRESYEEAKRLEALCSLRDEQFSEVQEIISNLRAEFGNRFSYEYILGRLEKLRENYDKAITFFKKALQLNRQHMSSMREIAESYYRIGKTETAMDYIKKANKIDQGNSFIAVLESRILAETGRTKEALAVLDNPSLKGPNMSSIFFQKGRVYDRIGNKNEACKYYQRAIDLNPKEVDARLCLLNHNVITEHDCRMEIELLKKSVRGKRVRVLLNIESRYIGYISKDPEKAIALLDTVYTNHRDRQWYAVRIQLLNILKESDVEHDRLKLARSRDIEIAELVSSYESMFKEKFDDAKAIIPEI